MRALIGWNSVLYQRTEHGLMTLNWLSKFCLEFCPNFNIPCAWLRQKECKRAICQQKIWLTETIVDNSSVKTNKQILNLANSSIIDSIIHYKVRNYRTEITNSVVSVDDGKLYFCKNQKEHINTCSVVVSHITEVNLSNFLSSLIQQVISWKLAPVLQNEQVGAV